MVARTKASLPSTPRRARPEELFGFKPSLGREQFLGLV
jgi:hypothetical protein